MDYHTITPTSIPSNYYVYVLLDQDRPGDYTYSNYHFSYEPFYLGKGKGDRALHHLRESTRPNTPRSNLHKLNRIRACVQPYIAICVYETENECEALQVERELITIIGRSDIGVGPLTNLTDGGEGGSGRVVTEHTRELIRALRIGKPSPKSQHTRTEKWLASRRGYPKTTAMKEYLSLCNRGEHNKRSRLTEDQVIDIRNSVEKPKELAYKYNVSINTIRAIRARLVWRHLP